MKKSLGQIALLSMLLMIAACGKKEESNKQPEKEVSISAAPADPVQPLPAGEDAEQAMKDVATQGAEQAQEVSEADLSEDVPEVIDFDEEAAKTATADAEVEDDAEK